MDALEQISLPPTLNPASTRALLAELEMAISNPGAKVIVIAGGDGVFCRGLDLAVIATGGNNSGAASSIRDFASCLELLGAAPKPTIALIDGVVQGGGVGLAAACDVAIATEGSSFGLPEALFGLVPGLIAPYLLERITPHAMRLWAMECKNRAASDALAAGLIDEIVVADGLAQAAAAWARKLSRLRPENLVRLRDCVKVAQGDRQAAVAWGITSLEAVLTDDGLLRSLRTFEETGQPPWEDECGVL